MEKIVKFSCVLCLLIRCLGAPYIYNYIDGKKIMVFKKYVFRDVKVNIKM